MTLLEFIIWIVNGGGAGIIAWWLMGEIKKRADISAELTRYLSLVLAGVLAALFYAAGVWMGYEPTPATSRAWLEAIFSVVATAVIASQSVHGYVKARRK